MRQRTRWLLAVVLAAAGCGAERAANVEGRLLSVDTLSARAGVDLYEPIAVMQDRDGAVYVLDRGNSELYRFRGTRVDTLASAGSGPGELKQPSVLGQVADTIWVVDEGNGRIQALDRDGRFIRSIPYARGAQDAVIDPTRRALYAATFGQNFALVDGRPVLRGDSLIAVVSLDSGDVIGQFGAPRAYEGVVIPLLGNYVRVARDPRDGSIVVAWPYEPHVERFTASGERAESFQRPLAFTPPPPSEYATSRSPLPAADAQLITYDIELDAAGRLFVLTAVAAKTARLGSEEYRVPAQAVDVIGPTGTLECRLFLPFTAWSLALAGQDELLLTDILEEPALYRLRYHCPRS
ncbi:MAG TPA: hypothetical protein VIL18_01025 [Longimicrobiales bacterium]